MSMFSGIRVLGLLSVLSVAGLAGCDTVQVRTPHPEQARIVEKTVQCSEVVGRLPPRPPAYRVVVLRDGRRVIQPIAGGGFGRWDDLGGMPVWGAFGNACSVGIGGLVECYGRQRVRVRVTPVSLTRTSGKMSSSSSEEIVERLSSCRF